MKTLMYRTYVHCRLSAKKLIGRMLSQLHRGLRQAAKHAVVYMVYDPYGFYIGLEYFC